MFITRFDLSIMFNAVNTLIAGRVDRILAERGHLVGRDRLLMLIQPEAKP